MTTSLTKYKFFFWLLCSMFALISCKKDEVIDDDTPRTINNWIFEQMSLYYLWSEEIPGNVNTALDPSDYFKQLLNDQDKYSIIVPDYQDLINSLSGVSKEAGYELAFVQNQNGEVRGWVQYVKKGSPSYYKGLKRGDIIHKINGQTITGINYQNLYRQLSSDHTIEYQSYDDHLGAYVDQAKMDLEVIVLNENPHYLDTVLISPNGRKVGYYVYNFFSNGLNNARYDQVMDEIFDKFKSETIEEMVLDLRYNGGGAVSSAVNLASLLGKDVNNSKIFAENRYNQAYMDFLLSRSEEEVRSRFVNKSANIGGQLSSGRIFVLTDRNTASASELVINGLRPFMQVYLIGRTTSGKNVGSRLFIDQNNRANSYGLLPIIFQSYNSLGESDYGNGFSPDLEINEYEARFRMLGDVEEPLLASALAVIDGSTARYAPPKPEKQVTPLISTLDKKYRNIFFDDYYYQTK